MFAGLVFTSTLLSYAQGKIAFDSCGDGNCEIYLINPDGTVKVRLTFNPAADRDPALDGIGTKIAFVSGRDGNDEIYTMNLDGSNLKRLTYSSRGGFFTGAQSGWFEDRICIGP
jgi:TolB protein